MCGIAGIFDTREQRPIEEALLSRMNQVQFHRGPDEGGLHTEPGVGLAHRRLSIIDLSNGHQPLFNEDGSVVVVYNGEIYNFPELMEELLAAGHRCSHPLRYRGDRPCLGGVGRGLRPALSRHVRLRPLGSRPADPVPGPRPSRHQAPALRAAADGRLLFGSELKALLVCPELPRRIDPRAVEDYFSYGYVPDPRTIFADVHSLEAGHTLTLRTGAALPAPRRYWDVPFRDNGVKTRDEAREELVERLREAVRIRLVAEVPLGAFLSGGVDSSAVVAMMAGLSEQPVNTSCISFGVAEFDEADYAAQVAKQYHPPPGGAGGGRRLRSHRPAGGPLRPALRGQFRHAHLPGVRAGEATW
jgi:asparagine synthase (glutamine-hydrolysing)